MSGERITGNAEEVNLVMCVGQGIHDIGFEQVKPVVLFFQSSELSGIVCAKRPDRVRCLNSLSTPEPVTQPPFIPVQCVGNVLDLIEQPPSQRYCLGVAISFVPRAVVMPDDDRNGEEADAHGPGANGLDPLGVFPLGTQW